MAYSIEQIETIFSSIIERIENGTSLNNILLSEGMPVKNTFYKWIDNDENKMNQYARAMEVRADVLFEEMLNIADTPQEGITIKETDKGIEKTIGDMIAHRKLQVDTRKWAASKMNPKKYGDKMQQDINIKTEQPLFGE